MGLAMGFNTSAFRLLDSRPASQRMWAQICDFDWSTEPSPPSDGGDGTPGDTGEADAEVDDDVSADADDGPDGLLIDTETGALVGRFGFKTKKEATKEVQRILRQHIDIDSPEYFPGSREYRILEAMHKDRMETLHGYTPKPPIKFGTTENSQWNTREITATSSFSTIGAIKDQGKPRRNILRTHVLEALRNEVAKEIEEAKSKTHAAIVAGTAICGLSGRRITPADNFHIHHEVTHLKLAEDWSDHTETPLSEVKLTPNPNGNGGKFLADRTLAENWHVYFQSMSSLVPVLEKEHQRHHAKERRSKKFGKEQF